MLHIAGLIVPIFAIIGFGRFAVSRGVLSPEGLTALNDFAYWLALPALLFSSIAESHAPQALGIAGIYLACCIVVFACAMLVGHLVFGSALAKSAIFALNATYGNVIFLGTPLVTAFFGPEGVTQIVPIIAFHSGVLLPLAAVLIELGSERQGGVRAVMHRTALGLMCNPVIMAILMGFAWRATGIAVPGPIHHLLAVLAALCGRLLGGKAFFVGIR